MNNEEDIIKEIIAAEMNVATKFPYC